MAGKVERERGEGKKMRVIDIVRVLEEIKLEVHSIRMNVAENIGIMRREIIKLQAGAAGEANGPNPSYDESIIGIRGENDYAREEGTYEVDKKREQRGREMEERETKKRNIVIKTWGGKLAEDNDKIKKWLEEEIGRIGSVTKLEDAGGKPGEKIIIVTLEREKDKKEILRKREEIKRKKGVIVGIDLTYKERRTREVVREKAVEERRKGRRVAIAEDGIWLEGKRWIYDEWDEEWYKEQDKADESTEESENEGEKEERIKALRRELEVLEGGEGKKVGSRDQGRGTRARGGDREKWN